MGTDEFGQSNDGYANGPRNLVIPSLGINGEVNKKGRRISWTNETEWTREAKNSGPDSGVNLSERWFRNGQATSINVAPDGRTFTITNEWGLAGGRLCNPQRRIKGPNLGSYGSAEQERPTNLLVKRN
jgi:hypothetical protein